MGASKSYMEIPGITGESTDGDHAGWHDVESFSMPQTRAPGGGGRDQPRDKEKEGESTGGELIVSRNQDGATAKFTKAATDGKKFGTVTLQTVTENGVVTVTLTDVFITSHQVTGAGSDQPMESFTLNFGSMKVESKQQERPRDREGGPRRSTAPAPTREEQPAEGTGPVGTGDHIVKDGDCISSIAKTKGHYWETIWNDPGNSELQRVRLDPNVLLKDDRVTIPPIRRKDEPGNTEMLHRFRRRGEPAKLRLRLVEEPDEERPQQEAGQAAADQTSRHITTEDPEFTSEPVEDRPRANVPYVLDIDGARTEGSTDADGRLELPIPGNAQRGILTLNPGTDQEEEIHLKLGHLSPISEIVGVKERLANLTFECGDRTTEMTDGLRLILRAFQEKNGLEPNGELTEETRNKIKELHGS